MGEENKSLIKELKEVKMAENLNAKRVSFSLASVFGIVYIACALIVAIIPNSAMKLFNNLFHGIDITKIADTTFSLSTTIIGFIEVVIFGLVIGWLCAVIYNKLK